MAFFFGPPDQPEDERGHNSRLPLGDEVEVLPYRVEIWDDHDTVVEQVVALTRHRTVGFAAFQAATAQFPRRLIKLCDQFSEIARWDLRSH